MTVDNHEATALDADHRGRRVCRHEWHLVSDDVDEFGRVRMLECHKCSNVHFT